jgi:DNA-binding GntR family transcriptional regulator
LIEPPVVRQVTPLIPEEDFSELRRIAESIVHWARVGDLAEYTEADRVFHLRLLEYAGNPRIVELVSTLRSQTRLLGLLPLLETGMLARTAEEHVELVGLMQQRRASDAEELMRKHISHVRGVWAGRQQ